ncbi:hypothetical protein ESZ50_00140 [Weissella muntiaci]|uniref:Gram-positive cocci surface proteins LPxTG domain-containing protein n=1 Tax=Weissella muntiaci TaxID=2508881 RepID=A0A6C2CBV6_9LACO|nr:hypothetical protein [Weissella muntiaci]TYC50979.1 hypothetical protein ESZ50_00140 [Weissella muntiaci]
MKNVVSSLLLFSAMLGSIAVTAAGQTNVYGDEVSRNETSSAEQPKTQIINYMDTTTGTKLSSSVMLGFAPVDLKENAIEDIAGYENKGYRLSSEDLSADSSELMVNFEHGTSIVNPLNSKTPDTPININDQTGVKWPAETAHNALVKSVNEIIHYVYEDGSRASADVINKVDFNHELIYDNVTGKPISDHGWTTNDKAYFAAQVSPTIQGYVPNQMAVAEVNNLSADSKDLEVTVVYKQVKSLTPSDVSTKPAFVDSLTPTKLATSNSNSDTLVHTATATSPAIEQPESISESDNSSALTLPKTGANRTARLSTIGIIVAAFGSVGLFIFGRNR